jgi:hypothetical protein
MIMRYRNLMAAIGFAQKEPTPVFTDNQPVIDLTKARSIPRPSRYLHSGHHFVRAAVAKGVLKFYKRDTNVHGPDLGTKPHGRRAHHFLTKITMNLPDPSSSAPAI